MGKTENKSGSAQVSGPETKVGITEGLQEEKAPIVVNPGGIVDVPVTVISLEGDPYHDNDHEFQLGKKTAEELVKRGWVKIKEEKEEKKK